MDHFLHPRNKGRPDEYDAVGRVGNPVCGDVMHIYIKVRNNRIEDIGWETLGCAAAIATSSMLSELAKGKMLDEALKLDKNNVAEALEGLPPVKMHCSNLAAEGLKKAIENFRNMDAIIDQLMTVVDQKDAEALFKIGIADVDELKKTPIDALANTVSDRGLEAIKEMVKR
jgi:nitrogen fixation NifU-like protein